MPDKWEYPWYFGLGHSRFIDSVRPMWIRNSPNSNRAAYARWYMNPNGEIPAYEWAFDDVNPPVHAWAAWRVFQIDRKQRREKRCHGKGDLAFLSRVFHKLMLNFTWWVNRKDTQGRNIFQGGFLGLDNIGVSTLANRCPTGGLHQSVGRHCLDGHVVR